MRFIVVPRHNNRVLLWEVIDTTPSGNGPHVQAERCRIGQYIDEHFAHGLAATLEGAGSVLDAEVNRRSDAEAF